jgi:hypothetical protein
MPQVEDVAAVSLEEGSMLSYRKCSSSRFPKPTSSCTC